MRRGFNVEANGVVAAVHSAVQFGHLRRLEKVTGLSKSTLLAAPDHHRARILGGLAVMNLSVGVPKPWVDDYLDKTLKENASTPGEESTPRRKSEDWRITGDGVKSAKAASTKPTGSALAPQL